MTASGSFRTADGLRLHWRAWEPEAPRAAVLLSHGLGEHGGRYGPLAGFLGQRGVAVYAPDHRGHGRSEGKRGHAPSFSRFVDDFERFRQDVAPRIAPGLPVFVYGHSMGGLVALRYLQAHPDAPLRGAVISAPLLALHERGAAWKKAAAGLLSRLLPALRIANEIDPAELSHDASYVQTYRDDPLVHPWITPRLYTEMLSAAAAARAEGGRPGLPLLFVIPGADPIVRADVTERFARGLAGDVTVRVHPGMYHEAHNETGRETVLAEVAGWIAERSGPPG